MGVEVDFQTSLFQRINAANLSGVQGVYDIAPQVADGGSDADFPYIVMGRAIATEMDTWGKNGFAMQIRIHTFSRSGNLLECKAIQGGIYASLHQSELTVANHTNISLLREDSDCFADEDGKIHGVCEYRALIETA